MSAQLKITRHARGAGLARPTATWRLFVLHLCLQSDLDEISKRFAALERVPSLGIQREDFSTDDPAMRNDQLYVLILPDVGMTPASRILAQYRIAPMQVSARGHLVTTGPPNIDYYLSSEPWSHPTRRRIIPRS